MTGNEIELLIAFGGVVVSAVVAFVVAKKYGDLAAAHVTRAFQEEDARKARIFALKALTNQIQLIRELVNSNCQIDPSYPNFRGLTKIPTDIFELSFFSGKHSFDIQALPLSPLTEYLSTAYHINSLIDTYLTLAAGAIDSPNTKNALKRIEEACGKMPVILTQLRDGIEKVLAYEEQQNH